MDTLFTSAPRGPWPGARRPTRTPPPTPRSQGCPPERREEDQEPEETLQGDAGSERERRLRKPLSLSLCGSKTPGSPRGPRASRPPAPRAPPVLLRPEPQKRPTERRRRRVLPRCQAPPPLPAKVQGAPPCWPALVGGVWKFSTVCTADFFCSFAPKKPGGRLPLRQSSQGETPLPSVPARPCPALPARVSRWRRN